MTLLQGVVIIKGMSVALKGSLQEVKGAESSEDWLSADEVAALCGMSHSRVCQLLRSGELPGERLRGKFWQVRRKHAERFIQQPAGKGRPRGS